MNSVSIIRAKKIANLWTNIITSWEKSHGKHFPWRENRTPYNVLISEILLKRTTPQTALKVIEEFIQTYPNIESLYNASVNDLEILIQPIGLSEQKSREIKLLVTTIEEEFNGQIPSDHRSLLELPGVGEYTASAIMCFGYQKNIATIGSNVDRILGRVFSARSTEIKTIAEILVDKNEPDVYNYGMLDLGSICLNKHPKCQECPVNQFCKFKRRGNNLLFMQ